MDNEELRPIPGFEELYAVTPDGRVWAYPRDKKKGNIWLKSRLDTDGNLIVSLIKNKKLTIIKVAKIVALTYIRKQSGKSSIKHKDGNKLNNHFKNLEWISLTEFHKNRLKAPLAGVSKRVKCITTGEVFNSISEAAKQKGICAPGITSACKGKYKHAGGLVWEYYLKS